MEKHLDDFSLGVLAQIRQHFPEWASSAVVENGERGEVALVVTVEPPSKSLSNPLEINTWRGEVTVSIDHYHAHFRQFDDGYGSDALLLLKQIISDEYAVVSYWRDQQWCGSLFLKKDGLPKDNSEMPFANKIRIRSWKGSMDKDMKCLPKGAV